MGKKDKRELLVLSLALILLAFVLRVSVKDSPRYSMRLYLASPDLRVMVARQEIYIRWFWDVVSEIRRQNSTKLVQKPQKFSF